MVAFVPSIVGGIIAGLLQIFDGKFKKGFGKIIHGVVGGIILVIGACLSLLQTILGVVEELIMVSRSALTLEYFSIRTEQIELAHLILLLRVMLCNRRPESDGKQPSYRSNPTMVT